MRALLTAVAVAVLLPPAAAASAKTGGTLSSRLAELAKPSLYSKADAAQNRALSLAPSGAGSLLRRDGRVLVQARFGRSGPNAAGVRAAGADPVNVSPRYGIVTAAVRPGQLHALARVPGVAGVTEVLTPLVASEGNGNGPLAAATAECTGAATSEGDTQLRAREARQAFGVDGTGATVGILSDSFDTDSTAATHAAGDVASGDLPGTGNPCGRTHSVNLLEDLNYSGDADEGRGMAQIVHDLAPGAKLAFATAFTSELGFAQNIERLARPVSEGGAGADVIADDVIYFEEPFFQEGPVAVAASKVAAEGVAYFSAAGNDNLIDSSGRNIASWEAPSFRDAATCPSDLGASGASERCMDFDPGGGTDNTFGITVSGGATLTVDLQWAEPQNGVSTDIDVHLLDSSGKQIKEKGLAVGGFEDNPGVSQKPVEVFQWTNSAGSAREVQVAIDRCFGECNPGASSETAPRLKLTLLQNGAGVTETEYPQSSGGDVVGPTIFGHSGASSVVSTGAVPYDSDVKPERYSSRGPVTHYFGPVQGTGAAAPLASPEVLAKPDLVATDGGANTFFGFLESGTWRFYGTSAAAPHAAAVAALIRDADPGTTPAQVRGALTGTARPVGSYGTDAVGSGLIDANAAVDQFAEEPPPDETPPDTTITSGPEGLTNDPTPTFGFSSSEEGSSFECRLDSGSYPRCTSPLTTSTLADGPHTLEVRAKDDCRKPRPDPRHALLHGRHHAAADDDHSGPEGLTNDSTPTFSFSSTEEGSSFECRLDSGSYSSLHLAADHRLAQPTAPTPSRSAPRTPPATSTRPRPRAPSPSTPRRRRRHRLRPRRPHQRLDPDLCLLQRGRRQLRMPARLRQLLRLHLAADHRRPSPRPPHPRGPRQGRCRQPRPDPGHALLHRRHHAAADDDRLRPRRARPTTRPRPLPSRASEEPISFECRLDSGSFTACSSPRTTSTLADGPHTFEVRATDAAGNIDPTPASRSFTVDTTVPDETPPDTTIDSGPEGLTSDPTPSFSFSSSEEGSSFECRLDSGSFSACTSPLTTAMLSDGPHTLEVRATDAAGNLDPTPASRSFTVDTPVPPSPNPTLAEPPASGLPAPVLVPSPVFPTDTKPPAVKVLRAEEAEGGTADSCDGQMRRGVHRGRHRQGSCLAADGALWSSHLGAEAGDPSTGKGPKGSRGRAGGQAAPPAREAERSTQAEAADAPRLERAGEAHRQMPRQCRQLVLQETHGRTPQSLRVPPSPAGGTPAQSATLSP